MNKSVLVIGNYPPPYGGVPHHIERLSEHLAASGWDCQVLSGGTTGTERLANGVTVHKPTFLRKARAAVAQSTNRRFHEWKGDGTLDRDDPGNWRRYRMYADVGDQIIRSRRIGVIASYNLLTYAPVGAYLAARHRLPHLINVFGELYKYPAMTANAAFFRHVARDAFRLLSCSDHCGRSVRRVGIESPVRTVTYGVDVEHFSPGPQPGYLRQRLRLGDDPVVLFVGRLSAEMGADSFLRAAKIVARRMPRARFVLVGQAGDQVELVRAECEGSGGRLACVVGAPYSELADYYRLATLVAVPTRGDRTCSSLAAMEAMSTGKAVVGFAIGGIPEIVEDGRTGVLVTPENTDDLAAAIGRMLGDTALRELIAAAGYAQAGSRFDERLVNIAMERHLLDALEAA